MERIAIALEVIAGNQSPEYQRLRSEYENFDWSSIHAEAVTSDEKGAIAVNWMGHRWTRVLDPESTGICYLRPHTLIPGGLMLINFVEVGDRPPEPG